MSQIETKPAGSYAAVTKSDSTVYSPVIRAFYIGTAGDLVLRAPGSITSVTFKNLANGAILPVKAERVMAATTAADIVALY